MTLLELASASPCPAWLSIAWGEVGVKEVMGPRHNARILKYHHCTTLDATDDETPWCSSFVNFCCQSVTIEGTRSAAARSWLEYGKECGPVIGAVVVMKRGQSLWSGHVGFLVGITPSHVYVLGGNQGDAVNVTPFPVEAVLGYRWPKG